VKRSLVLAAALSLPGLSVADVGGFVQLDQVELLGQLLAEHRFSERLGGSLRAEAFRDHASSNAGASLREATVDWTPGKTLNLKAGRQVVTWGVSEYLYVNDIFPKNYDVFFTGRGIDRMKEPVDGARLTWGTAAAEFEAVVARGKSDRIPSPERFDATALAASAVPVGGEEGTDAAIKLSTQRDGWDIAAYAGSFRSREHRYFLDAGGLWSDRPRLQHLGMSVSGNSASGVVWVEAALRRSGHDRSAVVSRHFLGSSFKLIAGYSREVGVDVTASGQLQLEAATERQRYLASLAPGVLPLPRVVATLHMRLQGRFVNQTVGSGVQLFAGSEGDTHLNPFASWSPADGWTLEAGAHVFNGKPETRYGAFRNDSNLYVLARNSF
jgi:hypothetical protein